MNLLTARKILELPDDYNEIILKKNYKSLAMKYHPDKNKETNANEKFSEINTAYEFLLKKPIENLPNHQGEIEVEAILKSFADKKPPDSPLFQHNFHSLVIKCQNLLPICSESGGWIHAPVSGRACHCLWPRRLLLIHLCFVCVCEI